MRIRGPWSRDRVAKHLEEACIPLRLGVTSASGGPVVLSLWYLHRDGALWCATPAKAQVVRLIERDPRCGFEVAADAPPYRGVRGRGRASLHPDAGDPVLRALLHRYRGGLDEPLARTLLARDGPEMAIRIDPERLFTWDFSGRMG